MIDFFKKPITRGDKTGKFRGDVVVSLPDIRIWKIDYLQDEFIMMASDGLFDVYTNEKIVDFIREKLLSMPLMEQVLKNFLILYKKFYRIHN